MSWTQENKQIVAENLGKLDISDIAKLVGKSERAVKQYLRRNRISYRPVVKVNIVLELIELAYKYPEYFTPTTRFFHEVGISRIRFWRLYRGEARPTQEEYSIIREHLGVNPERVFEGRQMNLFENEGGVKANRRNKRIESVH